MSVAISELLNVKQRDYSSIMGALVVALALAQLASSLIIIENKPVHQKMTAHSRHKALAPWLSRRSVAALIPAAALAPRATHAAPAQMPIGALLPLVELRASIVDAQRDLDERDDVPAARRRILTLIQSRELFRTVVAQNTQRYGEAIDDVSERAKNELRVLRTADRVVAKLERAELALSQKGQREEATLALKAARSGVEALLEDQPVPRAETLLGALRAADGDGDGLLSDAELASLPGGLREEAYDAQGVLADAAALSPKGDRSRKLSAGSRIFLGIQ